MKIPKDTDPKSVTREQAEEMLKNKPKTTRRGVRGGRGKSATKTTKRATTKKTTAKKSTAKTARKSTSAKK